ncbi:hypothetical protein, partial [Glaciecola sp. 1036]|uniref:hypothetical protein n=1 Tax=Alteromonadaceae TaxID=72275 RepID=UPI003CFED6A9
MKECINYLLQYIQKPLNSLLYIGAGTGSSIPVLKKFKAENLTLVEGSTQLYAALEQKAKKHSGIISFKNWVFPGSNQKGDVFTYNNPRYNSLLSQERLASSHPNLKLISKEIVAGISINSLLSKFSSENDQANILILSVNGGERFLLESADKNLIEKFEYVILDGLTHFAERFPETLTGALENFTVLPNLSTGIECCIIQRVDCLIQAKNLAEKQLQETEEIKRSCEKIEAILKTVLDERDNLQIKLTELLTIKKQIEGELQVKSEKTNELNAFNQKKQEIISKLEQEIKSNSSNFKELKSEYEILEVQYKQLNVELIEVSKAKGNQEKIISEFEHEISLKTSICNELTEKLESVEIKNNQLNNKLTEMSGTLVTRESRISELEEEVSLKTSNCNEFTEKLESVEIKNNQLNNKLTEMSGTLVTCENRISELEEEVSLKTSNCNEFTEKLESVEIKNNQLNNKLT